MDERIDGDGRRRTGIGQRVDERLTAESLPARREPVGFGFWEEDQADAAMGVGHILRHGVGEGEGGEGFHSSGAF